MRHPIRQAANMILARYHPSAMLTWWAYLSCLWRPWISKQRRRTAGSGRCTTPLHRGQACCDRAVLNLWRTPVSAIPIIWLCVWPNADSEQHFVRLQAAYHCPQKARRSSPLNRCQRRTLTMSAEQVCSGRNCTLTVAVRFGITKPTRTVPSWCDGRGLLRRACTIRTS